MSQQYPDELSKAVQRAIDGGWDFFGLMPEDSDRHLWFETPLRSSGTWIWDVRDANGRNYCEYAATTEQIIFDHDFAKALWGTESGILDYIDGIYVDGDGEDSAAPVYVRCYEKHLMQMVIADDPMKYLGKNLPGAES